MFNLFGDLVALNLPDFSVYRYVICAQSQLEINPFIMGTINK